MPNNSYRRGTAKENDYARRLEAEGWVCAVTRGSHGPYDVMAVKAGERTRLIQVKSDRHSPFAHFLPADRAALVSLAEQAGAEAVLVHYPPYKGPVVIPASAWPGAKRSACVEAGSVRVLEIE